MKTDILDRARFDIIRYAQCWEDPYLNQQALAVTEDDYVVSIASGGDNTFALLLDNPKTVVGCDISEVQLFLCELKKLAIAHLSYSEMLALLGITYSSQRLKLFDSIKNMLPTQARHYFESRRADIESGIIHAGKFENYFRHFRQKVLPLTHGPKVIERLLHCMTLEEQQEVYHRYWDNPKWRLVFRLFSSKFVLGHFGRDPEFFKYVKESSVTELVQRRIKHVLTTLPIQDNFYLHYIFTGRYLKPEALPPYLLEKNFDTLKSRIDRVSFCRESAEDHMLRLPKGTVSKINYSNIFEYMSETSMEAIFQVLVERGRPGMTIAYRNLFVPRQCPTAFRSYFETDEALGKKLHQLDRSMFYQRFVVERFKA
jgi:S-adenosylmethionine-diacylglycerol 3-amino-3-carboxypropyl transferase